LLAEIGPISRFKTDAQLARHSGVAPLEASSGKNRRHRLDRGGNRQLNAALYRIAITQSRYHPEARAYLERKQAEGKTRREAIRCLKRLLARTVFNTLKASPALTEEQHSPRRASLLMAVSDGDDEQSRLPRVGFDSRGGRQLVEGCCHTNRVC
jgi:transposase